MFNYAKRLKGFTLIELLIVITIIGILAVALVPRITGGPAKARDASRKADLQQYATALEFYADDNSAYPNASGCLATQALDSYLTTLPTDPSSAAITNSGLGCDGYDYYPLATDEGYMLVTALESTTGSGDGVYDSSAVNAIESAVSGASDTAADVFTTLEATTYACVDGTSTQCVYVVGR